MRARKDTASSKGCPTMERILFYITLFYHRQ